MKLHDEQMHHLGSGCYGDVYLVPQHEKNGPIVMKRFSHEDEYYATKEMHALHILESISYVNVPRPYYMSRCAGHQIIILMTYIQGLSFEDAIAAVNSAGHLFGLVECLIEQVSILHQHGFIHGDIHGANVLVSSSLEITLIDVGFCQLETSMIRDCWRLLSLLSYDVIPRLQALKHPCAEKVVQWSCEMEQWLGRDTAVSAHHMLYAWRHAVPYWISQCS